MLLGLTVEANKINTYYIFNHFVLYSSWCINYSKFKKLCQRYCDPRLPSYQRAFHSASINPPYLPYIGDLFAQLLGHASEISKPFIGPSLENAVAGAL
jgi:hypothetical protein